MVCSNSTLFSSPATVRLMNSPLPQPIQMSDRDLRRPFILLVAEVVEFPPQNALTYAGGITR